MKKLAVAAMCVTMFTGVAHAEHKLLVTDVLKVGQVEAQANLEYSWARGNLSILDEPGKVKLRALESRFTAGAGIGFGAEVAMSVPYLYFERERVDDPIGTEFGDRDGLGDLTVGIKKTVVEVQGVQTVIGMDVKFDTASEAKGGTGTTDVQPYLALSKEMGHHLVPYAAYRAIIRNHDAADTHRLTLGFEKELNHTVTLDIKGEVSFNTSSELDGTANQTYGLEAGSYLQLAPNFYLLPSVAVFSNTKSENGALQQKAISGFRPGIAAYYLF